jgi:hypothetical protein
MNDQAILPIGDITNNSDVNPMIRKHSRGPEGMFCGGCVHMVRGPGGHTRTYWKCDRRGITNGQGTDHRMKWSACRLYEATP